MKRIFFNVVIILLLISKNILFGQENDFNIRLKMHDFLISVGDADTASWISHPNIKVERLTSHDILTDNYLANITDGLYGFGQNTDHFRQHLLIVCNQKFYFVNMNFAKNVVLRNVDSLFSKINCFTDSIKCDFRKIISIVHYQNWLYGADLHLLPYSPYAEESLDQIEIELIEEEPAPFDDIK